MPRQRTNKKVGSIASDRSAAGPSANNRSDNIPPKQASLRDNEKTKIERGIDNPAEQSENLDPIAGLKSLLHDDEQQASSSKTVSAISDNAAALYDELDYFRQRWKRELENSNPSGQDRDNSDSVLRNTNILNLDVNKQDAAQLTSNRSQNDDIQSKDQRPEGLAGSTADLSLAPKPLDSTYERAKKLFTRAVQMEQDDQHFESIRYYREAMHLCPDIEKRIFREQCEESAKEASNTTNSNFQIAGNEVEDGGQSAGEHINVLEMVRRAMESESDGRYSRPATKTKPGLCHISDLPYELMLSILRSVVGEELDLASLESFGMVCRGFYLLSRDQSIWRSVCYATWGSQVVRDLTKKHKPESNQQPIDWRQIYIERPRVNFDGLYISRTRYIRQGDVGFQDITYRPFHVVRYYRYLRFFPNKKVLILTTNEEPDKIVPIFRHAFQARQFSSELTIMDGNYEFVTPNLIQITAEKDFRLTGNVSQNLRRQAQFHWSRQTPISQRFEMKFELRTVDNKPYRNNILKWLDYAIVTRLETGQELTSFTLSSDTFPNLQFSRVRRFNLRLTNPLSSH